MTISGTTSQLGDRSPEEIRSSIQKNRAEFETSLRTLRSEITKATDWRSSYSRHRTRILVRAAVGGFVLGGGLGGIYRLIRPKKKS